jgi:hypothetical protein
MLETPLCAGRVARIVALALVLVLVVTVLTPSVARAEQGCPGSGGADAGNYHVGLNCQDPSNTPNTPATPQESAGCFTSDKVQVPCAWEGAWWNGACYVGVYSSSPDDPDPAHRQWWDYYGQTEGNLLTCKFSVTGGTISNFGADILVWWAATPDPAPSAAELANAAYLLVEGVITAPGIGMSPGPLVEDNPDGMT